MFKDPQADFNLDRILGEAMQFAQSERVRLGQKSELTTSFTCPPGKCGEYSSTNYFLLGVLLAQTSGAKHWMDYDQSSFLPDDVRKNMPNTEFPLTGVLKDYTNVHPYFPIFEETGSSLQKGQHIDASEMNANSAFTC